MFKNNNKNYENANKILNSFLCKTKLISALSSRIFQINNQKKETQHNNHIQILLSRKIHMQN